MKKLFILFIVYLFVYDLNSQSNSEIDSLLRVLKNTHVQLNKANSYSRLAWLHINADILMAKTYNDSANTIYNELNDEQGIASSNYKYGVINRISGNYSLATDFIDKSLQYYEEQKDTTRIANTLFQKGVIYSMLNDYEKSLNEFYKIVSIYEAKKDSTGIGVTMNSIGITYKNLKKYEEAIKSFKTAIDIHEESNDLLNLPNAYSNLGAVYMDQKKFNDALEYLMKARKINIETDNIWGLSINSQNIGSIMFERKEYDKALNYFNEAYQIQKRNNYKTEMAATLAKLGYTYLELDNYEKSEINLKEGLSYVTDSKITKQELHSVLSKLYKRMGEFNLALHHYEIYTNYKDSIFEEGNIKNINLLQIQYETEKKDRELVEKQLQLQQKKNELQKADIQNKYFSGIAFLFLMVSVLLFVLYKQYRKQKDKEIISLKREQQVKTLESLILGEEKERFRIAKELHDGVNGDLSAIKYKLTSLLEKNNIVINEAVEMIDKSCEHVRAISHNLIPPSLEKFNLIEAVDDYCASANDIHEPEITFQHIGKEVNISKKVEVNIFRIIQEIITNSIKHAKATEINVQISNRNNNLQITIEDNGVGFNKNIVSGDGIGLNNIQSRVDYLNANLDLVSNNKGTSYTIEIDTSKLNDN